MARKIQKKMAPRVNRVFNRMGTIEMKMAKESLEGYREAQ
jgi:hypothetical protein